MTIAEAMAARNPHVPESIDRELAQVYYTTWEDRSALALERRRWSPRYVPEYNALREIGLGADHKQRIKRLVSIMPRKYLKEAGINSLTFRKRSNIVVPCFDAPGRLRSVIHLNAKGSPSVIHLKNKYLDDYDFGVAFLNDVAKMQDINTLYVMNDALRATQMQYRHLLLTGKMLPLLVRSMGSPVTYCRYVNAKRVVMVLDAVDTSDIEAALRLRGRGMEVYVAHVRDLPNPPPTGLHAPTPPELLATARRASIPVLKLLQMCSDKQRRNELPFDLTGLSTLAAGEFLSDSTPEGAVQPKAEGTDVKEAVLGSKRYYDKEDGVFSVKRGELHMISNVRMIPKWVVTIEDNGDVIYSGDLAYNKKVTSFAVSGRQLYRNGHDWLQRTLASGGHDIARMSVAPATCRLLYSIGEKVHRPQPASVLPPLQPRKKDKRLTLPSMQVTAKGLQDMYLTSYYPDAPCRYLAADWQPDKEELVKLLGESETNKTFWAVMVYMLSVLLAPYYGLEARSLVIHGGCANVLDWFTEALTLARQVYRYGDRSRSRCKAPGADYAMPVKLDTPYDAGAFNHMLDGKQLYVVEGSDQVADAILATGKWLALDAHGCQRLQTPLTVANVLASVLHRVYAKRYAVPKDLLTTCAHAVHDWLTEQGIKGQFTVIRCVDNVRAGTDIGDTLLEVLVVHALIACLTGDVVASDIFTIMKKRVWIRRMELLPALDIHYSEYQVPKTVTRQTWASGLDIELSRRGVINIDKAWVNACLKKAKAILKDTEPEIFQQCCKIKLDDLKPADEKKG
jgi:hypothetical protein